MEQPSALRKAATGVPFFSYAHQTVHEAQLGDLPAPMQDIWKQWSSRSL